MSLVKPFVADASTATLRKLTPGDLLGAAESLGTALTTIGAGTVTGLLFATNILTRTGPTAGYTDTLPTAADLVATLNGTNFGGQSVSIGDTYRIKYINSVAFAATLAIGLGGTLGANATGINASSVKELLVTITNATPSFIGVGATTTGSPTVTGLTQAQLAQASVGMVISSTSFAGNPTVIGVNQAAGTVTLSSNATATTATTALTFSPAYRVDSLGQGLL